MKYVTLAQAPNTEPLQFYATASYPCSYLPGRLARSQVVAPPQAVGSNVYSALVDIGFRRSGTYIYRPHCQACQACVSIRVPVQRFVANRSQRRAWQQHAELDANLSAPFFLDEHFALYSSYQKSRHAGGGMDHDDVQQYLDFLLQSHVSSLMVEFRQPSLPGKTGALKMVSIIDQLQDGLSAVYTFYDPAPGQSLGTFNVLWQIQLAQQLGLSYLYLGYWIKQCSKMAYKARFQPHELFEDGRWVSDFTR